VIVTACVSGRAVLVRISPDGQDGPLALYGDAYADAADFFTGTIGLCVAMLKASRPTEGIAYPFFWALNDPTVSYTMAVTDEYLIKVMYWRQRYQRAFTKARSKGKEDMLGAIRLGYARKMLSDLTRGTL